MEHKVVKGKFFNLKNKNSLKTGTQKVIDFPDLYNQDVEQRLAMREFYIKKV